MTSAAGSNAGASRGGTTNPGSSPGPAPSSCCGGRGTTMTSNDLRVEAERLIETGQVPQDVLVELVAVFGGGSLAAREKAAQDAYADQVADLRSNPRANGWAWVVDPDTRRLDDDHDAAPTYLRALPPLNPVEPL